MGSGQTAGVFQVEGGGMTRYLVQMKPKTLDNIIAMVALYRPGPMAFIPDYIARMHGEAEVEYRHPALGADLPGYLRHSCLSGTTHARRRGTGGIHTLRIR